MSIISAMRKRYPPESYALMFEVGNGTGTKCDRHADALVVSLWPSRGIHLYGFEFKASRSDWLKELSEPAKAESFYRHCHRWYLVTDDASIVKHGELPNTWGHLTMRKDGNLKEIVRAPQLDPLPVPMELFAAMLRSAAKPAVKEDNHALLAARNEGYEEGQRIASYTMKDLERRLENLQNEKKEFKKEAGFFWNEYAHTAADVGRVVREVLSGEHKRDTDDLQRIRNIAAGIVERLDASLGTTKEVTV